MRNNTNKTVSQVQQNNVEEVSTALLSGIKEIVRRRNTPWVGTITELNLAVQRALRGRVVQSWPKSSSSLRVSLNRVIRQLRSAGITVRFSRATDRSRTRLVEFSKR